MGKGMEKVWKSHFEVQRLNMSKNSADPWLLGFGPNYVHTCAYIFAILL